MDELIAAIKGMFPRAIYGQPCTEAELAEAEKLLGQKLPNQLRTIYLNFNGIEIYGFPSILYQLLPRHNELGSLVDLTIFLQKETPLTKDVIVFGMSSQQRFWAIRMAPSEVVVQYNHDDDEPEVMGTSVLDAFRKDAEWCRENGFIPTGER